MYHRELVTDGGMSTHPDKPEMFTRELTSRKTLRCEYQIAGEQWQWNQEEIQGG